MQGPILSRTCPWEMAAFPETDRLPQERSLRGNRSACNRLITYSGILRTERLRHMMRVLYPGIGKLTVGLG